MFILSGKPHTPGVAYAVVAIIDEKRGVNAVSPEILATGLKSLQDGLEQDQFPHVVVACDNPASAMLAQIPGIKKTGIAAEDDYPDEAPISVPCVKAVDGLLRSVGEDTFLIIDGNRGVVIVDPDPGTIMHYQQTGGTGEVRKRIYIDLSHMPAKTQAGETINVWAMAASEEELETALRDGADGVIYDLREIDDRSTYVFADLIAKLTDKPAGFIVDFPYEDLARAAVFVPEAGQLTILFPLEKAGQLSQESFPLPFDEGDADEPFAPSQVSVGTIIETPDYDPELAGWADQTVISSDIIDFAKTDAQMMQKLMEYWSSNRSVNDVLLVIGEKLERINPLIAAGARSIVVSPDKLIEAKDAIRSYGLE